ncbi:pyruvate kinase [Schleiferia thermophila]|uniref:Pyruvate kinase n=1 Tax=Schleiferia thermophila TaxID=884107 RepID=A0A369A8X8_9FLAO|nr:pyruvate kinase [Schleiferia thermophila]RCX04868.1 pyruvate kinase [Schleiferia thermophila]GCD79608.1 pyruvate kinase [Schleiferia thermophila]
MHFNKTKIVATLGPSSAQPDIMLQMAKAGVSVFRINCSHGKPEDTRHYIRLVKELNQKHNLHISTLADLQGPKLRIGEVEEGIELQPGDTLTFTNHYCVGNAQRVYMTYKQFPQDVRLGEKILLDDGKLILEVIDTNKIDEVKARVIQGGPLKSKKGVNLPSTKISLPCLTEKDLEDLKVALDEKVDWIGLSFVRSATDVAELRRIIDHNKSHARIVSKIEKPEAIVDIDNIIDQTDALMVARGDLGVEVPMQGVPLIQKLIVKKALAKAKPVIIATQMMESMINSLTPTRAEVNDVANSVLDGADAVMLSGETSVGKYPVQVIEAMAKIIKHVEDSTLRPQLEHSIPTYHSVRFITDSICYNASKISNQIGAMGILTMTHSGYTAFKISSHRPDSYILVFTANRDILTQLSLVWGVKAFYYDKMTTTDESFADIAKICLDNGLLNRGDFIIQIASMPIYEKGMTNTLKITQV